MPTSHLSTGALSDRSGAVAVEGEPSGRLIRQAAEELSAAMLQQGVSRAELARRVGSTRGYATRLLSGEQNLTLVTLERVGAALGVELEVRVRPRSMPSAHHLLPGQADPHCG